MYEAMHRCVSIHNESSLIPLFNVQYHNYIMIMTYIRKPYLFLDIYDLLNIPHLAVIFVFTAI